LKKLSLVYDAMKITDECLFSEGWLKNFKETAAAGDIQTEYSSGYSCSPSTGAVT
jgi:hypothetical protein